MQQRDYDKMSIEELYDRQGHARSIKEEMAERMRTIDSAVAKIEIKALTKKLRELRQSYINVNVQTHPNVVIAQLADMQGQERNCLEVLRMLDPKNIKETYSRVDKELRMCEKALEEKQKEPL